ncbi:MAG: ZIP family metal transporter [Gemmatimonadaceae bacterium]
MPPAATLLAWTALAALAAGLGALVGARRPPLALLGWANAAASGLMLGVGYTVMEAGVRMAAIGATLGAAAGVLLMHLVRVESTALRSEVAASAMHSAAEGIAIGAAAAAATPLGLVLAGTLALHNVGEGAVLGAALAERGVRPNRAAGLATVARLGQPVLAAATFALLATASALLPWVLGAAFGALLYLVLAELLPASYGQVGRTSIALVVILAAGIVALLGGDVLGTTLRANGA